MIPSLDTALKHRLTGAVILILLAVLLLPELLTGSGRTTRALAPASADSGSGERSFDIDLTESARNVPAPVAENAAPAPPVNLPVPAAITPPPAAAATTPPPAAAATTPPAAAATTPPPPAAVVTTPPDPGVTAPVVAPAAATPAPAADAFYVQLGVFVNRASATNLARKLTDAKFSAVVDEIKRSGKTLFRVRVGPASDRATANALRDRLTKAGHKGSVVK